MINLLHLIVSPPDGSVLYMGNYNPILVGLSIFVAILTAYASLLVSLRVSIITKARTRQLCIAGGGLCFGLGIWAMHFIGMLAFSLPCSSNYDPVTTLLSMIPAVLASTLAIQIISRDKLSAVQLVSGGLLFGAGISAMHYSGMAAMHFNGLIRYDTGLFLLSVLVAIVLATLALWIEFRFKTLRQNVGVRLLSAVVMGLAVSGMHYTAMASAYFIRGTDIVTASSSISPGLLALIVLIATGLITVLTLIATYFSRNNVFSTVRLCKLPCLLLTIWIGVSWFIAEDYHNRLADDLIHQESLRNAQKLESITGNITESLKLLNGTAQVFARETAVVDTLRSFGANSLPTTLSYEKRKQRWSRDKALVELSQTLDYASSRFAADVIFILDAAGECIASSNIAESGSIVGVDLSDRLYFKQARAGQQGHQYAVGRATNQPGLFYASPVFDAGRFIGAVVVKRDVNKLARWTKSANVYITDANGVIVMAQDKQFELRYLPDATVVNLSGKDKLLLYKRSELKPLKFTPWENHASLVLIDEKAPPVMFASRALTENGINIYVHTPLNDLLRFTTEKYWLCFLLASAGGMLIIAVSAIVIYLRESQKLKLELNITATAFESDEGILISNANNEILRVNSAFTTITGYAAEEVIGKNPRILSSGKHNADFFAAMWDSIVATGTWSGNIWNRRKNGEDYPEHLIITAVKNADNMLVNYVSTFSDITGRMETETALRYSNQKMSSLLQSMAEGAYGVDINGNCNFVNESFLRILGYTSSSELIGRHIHDVIQHTHADGMPYPAVECRIYAAHHHNENIHCTEEVFWHKSGIAIPVEYWSRPIIIDDVIMGSVTTFIDISERKLTEKRMAHLATYDPLTNLPNRSLLRDRLKQALFSAKRGLFHVGLMFIDLDKFKPVNDTYGHALGDQVLIEAAKRMQLCIRASDTVARVGGDEFIVLLSEVDSEIDTLFVAEKIRLALNRTMLVGGMELHISSSIGIALFPEQGENETVLIKHADVAMYAAKQAGRDNVQVFRHNML